jgi:hypothetical protein
MSSLALRRLSSRFIRPAVSRTVPVYTKTLHVPSNIMASRSSSVSGLRPLRLPTGLSLPAPQPLVNSSQLHTSGTPRPSRILRPIGHRRTRSSSPRSTCVLCGARAPSPPHAASGSPCSRISLCSKFNRPLCSCSRRCQGRRTCARNNDGDGSRSQGGRAPRRLYLAERRNSRLRPNWEEKKVRIQPHSSI